MRIWHQSFTDLEMVPIYRRTLQEHAAKAVDHGTVVTIHGPVIVVVRRRRRRQAVTIIGNTTTAVTLNHLRRVVGAVIETVGSFITVTVQAIIFTIADVIAVENAVVIAVSVGTAAAALPRLDFTGVARAAILIVWHSVIIAVLLHNGATIDVYRRSGRRVRTQVARIHHANLVNVGILPLKLPEGASVSQGDELEIRDIRGRIEAGKPLAVTNATQGAKFEAAYDLTPRQTKILLAGGLLNYIKEGGR